MQITARSPVAAATTRSQPSPPPTIQAISQDRLQQRINPDETIKRSLTLVGGKESCCKNRYKWRNCGLCCCGWQTAVVGSDDKSFHVCREGSIGVLWSFPWREKETQG